MYANQGLVEGFGPSRLEPPILTTEQHTHETIADPPPSPSQGSGTRIPDERNRTLTTASLLSTHFYSVQSTLLALGLIVPLPKYGPRSQIRT
ncbi:hypothetical protein PGT21_025259 [Puccinia graminis f. sp. tritici]|uniref:Uncharacterized protein n=1 Tax=Puccinia graminis f. sp. tritici TaxID=56615 RepID=A0A5B0MLL4_PUCGR|nr:hypothetical protein PGT21_025259 [Puccinia graminis f. sp. tritici]